jgi:hypothetical protein
MPKVWAKVLQRRESCCEFTVGLDGLVVPAAESVVWGALARAHSVRGGPYTCSKVDIWRHLARVKYRTGMPFSPHWGDISQCLGYRARA